jgi:hypothetical protein
LAEDIERHLSGDPVRARPPSVGYKLGKFVRRNKWQSVAVGTITILLVVGLAGTTLGIVRARRSEVEANRLRLQSERNFKAAERTLKHLVETLNKLLGNDHPETIGQLESLGIFFIENGRVEEGRFLLNEVFEAYNRTFGPTDDRTLKAKSRSESLK